jgi:hypothetical protein
MGFQEICRRKSIIKNRIELEIEKRVVMFVTVKLYDRKVALVAADMLNDRVLPMNDQYGIPLMRIFTDRGTEFCGAREHHEYHLYLAIEDVEHTKAKSP